MIRDIRDVQQFKQFFRVNSYDQFQDTPYLIMKKIERYSKIDEATNVR